MAVIFVVVVVVVVVESLPMKRTGKESIMHNEQFYDR